MAGERSGATQLRVLQVVTDRDRRGSQVYALDLQPGLEALGCEVETVALAPGKHGDGLEIDIFGPTRRSPSTFRSLRRRARDFDVVIAHGSATLFACALALVGSRRPFVYRQISDPLFWAASWPRRLRVAAFIRRAKHTVCLSPGVAEVFARHYRLKMSKISVVPNAVPGERFAPPTPEERRAERAGLEVPEGMRLAVYVGALVEEKGVDLAIRALSDRPDTFLLLAGDGPERSALEALGAEMLGDRVRFLGPVPDPRPLYRAADVLLMPTRGGDSMPAVLIEAGLCGLPSVTCPIGAIEDVVLDGETGFVVAIDDLAAVTHRTSEILDDGALHERLAAAAVQHCRERFTIDATAPGWLEVLDGAARPVVRAATG